MTTLKINTGKSVTQTFTDIPQAEHFIAVTNGSPGLKRLVIQVNDKQYEGMELKDNETQNIDVANAMRPGNANTLTFVGEGKTGASADIFVSDTSPPAQTSPPPKVVRRSGAPQDVGTWGPLAEHVEDNSDLQFAQSSHQQIHLHLATALDRHTAAQPGLYTVQVHGRQVGVTRVKISKHTEEETTVILTLPARTMQAGDEVEVTWDGVETAEGQRLSGHVSLVAE
jgi:hypothetical protein